MDDGTYRFSVGDFQCAAVSDGDFVYEPPMFPAPARFLFANAPGDRLAHALAEHGLTAEEWDSWRSSYTCLLVDVGASRVLVDTGAGELAPSTGALSKNLASLGVEPGEIDLVILTHAHPDHLGGNVDGKGRVAFPRARWMISRTEWEFWMEGQAEAVLPEHGKGILLGSAQRNLSAIRERVDLVGGDTELLPGVSLLASPGHTPGHSAVAITSRGEGLLYLADLVLHPFQLEEPEWYAGVDVLPEQLVSSRRALLGRATREGSLVMLYHFPLPRRRSCSVGLETWRHCDRSR